MTRLDEVYEVARECAVSLRAAGLISQGEALEDALRGSTSGEILADLGSSAQAVLRSGRALPTNVRGRLATLLRDVDRILRDAGRS